MLMRTIIWLPEVTWQRVELLYIFTLHNFFPFEEI